MAPSTTALMVMPILSLALYMHWNHVDRGSGWFLINSARSKPFTVIYAHMNFFRGDDMLADEGLFEDLLKYRRA